jgi:Ca2+-binding EF-hand superfamily protein
MFQSKSQSLQRLLQFFNLGNTGEIDPNDVVRVLNTLNGQDFRSFPLCHAYRYLGTAAESELTGTEIQLRTLLIIVLFQDPCHRI